MTPLTRVESEAVDRAFVGRQGKASYLIAAEVFNRHPVPDGATAYARVSEGHCPLCAGRIVPSVLDQRGREWSRSAYRTSDSAGYCEPCDLFAHTQTNSSGVRVAMATAGVRAISGGPRPGMTLPVREEPQP